MLYGMISAIGVRNVVENHVDFTKSRNLIIAAVILVSGLGFANGLTFYDWYNFYHIDWPCHCCDRRYSFKCGPARQ